jgi:hypothetical protein
MSAVIDKPIGPPIARTSGVKTRSTSPIEATAQTDYVAAMTIMENEHMSEASDEKANTIFDAKTNQLIKYRKLITYPDYQVAWNRSSTNEFGQLAQGVGNRIKGTDTIIFVYKHEIPLDQRKDITRGKFVCE